MSEVKIGIKSSSSVKKKPSLVPRPSRNWQKVLTAGGRGFYTSLWHQTELRAETNLWNSAFRAVWSLRHYSYITGTVFMTENKEKDQQLQFKPNTLHFIPINTGNILDLFTLLPKTQLSFRNFTISTRNENMFAGFGWHFIQKKLNVCLRQTHHPGVFHLFVKPSRTSTSGH